MPLPDYLAHALSALDAHAPAYDEAEAYFEGVVPEVITSRRLRQLFGQGSSPFRINYARTPVDVLLERTQIQGIACSDAGALKLLDAIWDANQLGLEAKDIHRMTYEFGDAFLIGWPDDELEGGVSLFAHDPRAVRVFYDASQPRRKSHAVHRWVEPGDEVNGFGDGLFTRVNLYSEADVEQWVSRYRIDGTHGLPVPIVDEPDLVPLPVDPVIANPTAPLLPVFHFRNARPFGRPEHADAFGPQDVITKLLVTMMVSVDFAGYPQRYVSTDSALSPAPAADAFGPPPDDSLSTDEGLSVDSEMEAGPGSTWLLSGSKIKVGQFPHADTSNFLNAIHSLIKQMAAVTDIPGHYFDRSGQMPSGESFRRAEQPLSSKVADREALLGVTWHELFDWCLAANNTLPSDAQPIWAPPQIWNDQDSWKTAALQLDAGVPLDQVLRERGYSEENIALWTANQPERGLA
jgi:Phage portal protein, SPP1 Gp6-like